MSYFIRNANMFNIASEEALDIQKVLPVGNYTVKQNPMSGQFYLEMVDSFEPMKKLYGNTTKNSDRILRTYLDRPNSTGVMLTGEKVLVSLCWLRLSPLTLLSKVFLL